jgi:hypothetical protein
MDACRFPRRSAGYPVRRRILIVGEGKETEPNYFRAFAKEHGARCGFCLVVKGAGGYSPEHCINRALQELKSAKHRGQGYDEVWCVFDVESVAKAASLAKALAAARKSGIRTCLSNPSFEVWLIAHFERTSKSFIDAGAAEQHLDGHWHKACGQPYDKADSRVYERVRAFTETAITNAREVHVTDHGRRSVEKCNSSTEVYRLVSLLLARA